MLNRRSTEVSEATSVRVRAAVEALGYQPNALARSLAGRPTRSLGLIWAEDEASLGEDGLSSFLAGLGEATYASGYTLTLAGGVKRGDLRLRLRELKARQVDGLLVLAAAFPEDGSLETEWAGNNCPVVVCGPAAERLPAARVDVDQEEGMRLAGTHLLTLGHRSFAYLDAPGAWPYPLRRAGFLKAVAAADPPAKVSFAVTDGSEASGYHVGEELLARPDRPTAFACANDALAVGLLRAAWQRGVAVPEEVAVVGFGDSPAAAYTVPTLTTVRGSLRTAGTVAGRVLIGAVDAGEPALGTHLIPPKLIVRESCGSHLWL